MQSRDVRDMAVWNEVTLVFRTQVRQGSSSLVEYTPAFRDSFLHAGCCELSCERHNALLLLTCSQDMTHVTWASRTAPGRCCQSMCLWWFHFWLKQKKESSRFCPQVLTNKE